MRTVHFARQIDLLEFFLGAAVRGSARERFNDQRARFSLVEVRDTTEPECLRAIFRVLMGGDEYDRWGAAWLTKQAALQVQARHPGKLYVNQEAGKGPAPWVREEAFRGFEAGKFEPGAAHDTSQRPVGTGIIVNNCDALHAHDGHKH